MDTRPSNAPPPYDQSSSSPLVLAETTTTRTEIVTTTTTETTTHLFSIPHWRKRDVTSPASQRHNVEDISARQFSIPAKSPSSALFVDKALPPTPPTEPGDEDYATTGVRDPPKSAVFSPAASLSEFKLPSRTRKASAGPQSTVALAHAALGIGLPHASTSFSRPEMNVIPFLSPSSPSPSPSVRSPTARRVKSLHRVQKSQTSEDYENVVKGEEKVSERRRRGLSFGATSFLNIGNSDAKGKGRELETAPAVAEPSTAVPKPLSRKSSFWNRKKEIQQPEPTTPTPTQDDSVQVVPPLPSVHRIPPLDISDLPTIPPIGHDEQNKSQRPQELPRSHSDGARVSNSTTPNISATSPPSFPWPSSSQTTTSSNRSPEPQQPNGHLSSVPRPRRQTSTPLLHRLSLAVFSPGDISPTPTALSNIHSQLLSSPTAQHLPRKQEIPIPKPLTGEDESPEIYLTRLKMAVSKAEVAGILASSSDPFYARALQAYINQFDFLDIPLDVALRKLLMEVGLPRETQQIDRVMEAFASRYMQCNSDIFTSEDHPYILAFSLIMLHTDAFNPSNKRKMTKAGYIKNTKLPGIPTEILDCFFDNIVFAPFIFIEDPVDFNGQFGLLPDVTRSMSVTPTSAMSPNGHISFKLGNKIDPYYLISNNLLEPLRVDVNAYVPLENPFTYEGTNGPWHEQELHQAFVDASIIEIEMPAAYRATPIFSLSPIGKPGNGSGDLSQSSKPKVETLNLKITKVGLLNRKDDVMEGGRKSSNRKWRTWSVILTGSQLLLFRDLGWASALSRSYDSSELTVPPPSSVFQPDESFSVKDAIAVYDHSYTKYKHTLRFILPDARQILLQAIDKHDLNEWISRINYASTFKSAGVRMRSPGLSGEDVLLTGVAAATSHLHDMQNHPDLPRPRSWESNAPQVLMDMLSGQQSDRPTLSRRVTMAINNDFDLDAPVAPEIDGAEQFKATFDRVKADLAATSWPPPENENWLAESDSDIYDSPLSSPRSFDSTNSRLPSRSQIIQSKIRDLDSKILTSQSQLDSDVRLVRNIAILTPFQKSTRSRLSAAVQNIAKRITQVRLELEKLKCHCVVLRSDLSSEGRSWNRSTQVALRVAKETLQSRPQPSNGIPKMTLSRLDGPAPELSPLPHTPASPTADSSNSGSFHSAVEFGLGWPSSEDMAFLSTKYESPKLDLSSSMSSFVSVLSDLDSNGIRKRSSSMSSDANCLPSDYIQTRSSDAHEGDELAEEWNRTRCAQRVSLIRVPSDIKILTRVKGTAGS